LQQPWVRNLVVLCILLLVGLLTGFRPQGSTLMAPQVIRQNVDEPDF
jgi:hypothetical protein